MSYYENKKKMLFDCLSSAEKCIKGTSLDQNQFSRDETMSRNHPPKLGLRFRGKESIFKRPQAPIGKCLRARHTPDYQRNPHKWKKYSLDDADISDRTNASAAFAFLSEMEKRKDADQEKTGRNDAMDTSDDSLNKIVFKKKNVSNEHPRVSFNQSCSLRKAIDDKNESENKSILKGSKVVMSEYVIGQKAPKKLKSKPATVTTGTHKSDPQKKPTLQHLYDEDEEE